MIVYRIHKSIFHPLDGTGAALFGRRWNKRGTPVVYTSCTLALARAEIGAKVATGDLPVDFVVSEIEISDGLVIYEVNPDELKNGWMDIPFPPRYQEIGQALLKQHGLFKVPSVKDPAQFNLVLDPNHPDVVKHVRVIKQYPLK